jgi:gluconate 2-dehydrogenase gamma chain
MSKRNLEGTTSRRKFLHQCGICTGTLVLPLAWARLAFPQQHMHMHSQETGGSQSARLLEFRFFNPAQAAAVEAVTDQIIPADDQPGAKQAGVVHYVDLLLTGVRKDLGPSYIQGIQHLEALAHGMNGKAFVELPFADQTKVLEKLEHDQTPITKGMNGGEFFGLMRRHTLEGFFGDPDHNRDSAGWKVLGFSG